MRIEPTAAPIITPAVTPPPEQSNSQNSYTIAVLGDSMIQTLGAEMWHLKTALKNYYPRAKFNLLN